jgi:signal transduction histidine kinase/ABC-type amino acid transport substrate-binding protein/ActR/RegA family two-component response regulator
MRRRVFLLWLTLALCFGLSIAAHAQDTVRVGYFDSGNGFFIQSSDGQPKSGYAYEYLQEIASRCGWEYDYAYGTWSDQLDQLRAGEIDLLFDVSYTPERAEEMLFSAQPVGTERFYIYTNTDLPTAIRREDLSTLSGAAIGVVTGTVQVEMLTQWLEEQGLDCQIVEFSGETDRLAAFDAGEIDAQVTMDTLVRDNWRPVAEIGQSDYYIAVSKDRPELLEQLNQAQAELLSEDRNYQDTLQKKYFSTTVTEKALADTESAWLADHGAITLGYLRDYFPYCGEENGALSGVLSLLVERLGAQYGISIQTLAYDSTEDLTAALEAAEIDVMFPVRGTLWVAEGQGFMLTEPLVVAQQVLLYSGDYDPAPRTLSEVRALSVTERYLQETFPSASILWADTREESFQVLLDDPTVSSLVDNYTYIYLQSRYSALERLHAAFLTDTSEVRLAVRRQDTALLTLLNKGIRLCSDDEINSALVTYSQGSGSYTLRDFLRDHAVAVVGTISGISLAIIAILCAFFLHESRQRRRLLLANQQAQQASRAKSQFLNNLSHDIRTPMNAVMGFTSLAQHHADQPDQVREYLDKISVSSSHLLGLLDDALDMSSLENGQLRLESGPWDLSQQLRDLETVFSRQFSEKRLEFSIQSDLRHPQVVCDGQRLRQVLSNLLSNGLKFTPPGGEVTLTAQEEPAEPGFGRFQFQVRDNGIGMSPDFQAHMFEPFSRERSATASGQSGTGLGLAITQRLVDAMGGQISIESAPGKGTTVTVRLTLALQSPAPDPQPAQAKTGQRVLLADDNALNLEIAAEILEAAGFTVETAENGEKAVEKVANSGPYDVVLMDIQMPVLDGYAAARAIRRLPDPARAAVPIIAMTADSRAETRQNAAASGMNGYLPKPIDIPQLLATLAALNNQGGEG